MNKITRNILAAALLLGAASPAFAKVNVFACEPEWGALATEIGGPLVDVGVGTTALQDVHQIEAKPSLIAKLCAEAGLRATAQKRLRIGRIALSGLPEGQWRYLHNHERF